MLGVRAGEQGWHLVTSVVLIAGMLVVFWCFATWLAPALIAAGIWRHAIKRVPLGYTSAVEQRFPPGDAVASTYLGRADHLPIIEASGAGWIWVALTAWAIVFAAMLRDIARQLGEVSRRGRAATAETARTVGR